MAATNALVAKAIIAATPYIHLVFSDIVMPGGLSGFDLARWIGEQYPALKVLLTSGFGEEIVHTNGGDQLARLLSKPYSAGELACAIKAALQN